MAPGRLKLFLSSRRKQAMAFPQRMTRGLTAREKCHQGLVLLACCLGSLLASGMGLGSGSVYLDIMGTFSTSRALAALPQSFVLGLGFAGGLLTGPLIGCVGEPIAMVTGSLLMCVGCIGSSLAPNIYVLVACFGCINGIGVSCLYLAPLVVAGRTFPEKRHLVVPMVSMCGGVGPTILSYLLRWLTDKFSLRGMYLILAGISLHGVLLGVIVKAFRPRSGMIPKTEGLEIEVDVEALKPGDSCCKEGSPLLCDTGCDQNEEAHSGKGREKEHALKNVTTGWKEIGDENADASSGVQKTVTEHAHENVPTGCEEIGDANADTSSGVQKTATEHAHEDFPVVSETVNLHCRRTPVVLDSRTVRGLETVGPRPIAPQSKHRETNGVHNEDSVVLISEDEQKCSLTEARIASETNKTQAVSSFSLYDTLQLNLLCNARYVLVTLTCFGCLLGLSTPVLFLTDIVKARGLSMDQGAQLLMILFGCNVTGRGAIGLLQSMCHLSSLRLFGVACFGAGLSANGLVLLDYIDVGNTFAAHGAVCAAFGAFLGAVVTCAPLCCMELVTATQSAQALGYMYFVGGVLSSVGGPLGGWVKDETGTYNYMFYLLLAQGSVALVTATVISFRRNHN